MEDESSYCEHCLHRFEVAKSQRGALVNCPECGKATRAGGSGDPLWTTIKAAAVVGIVAAGVIVGSAYGPLQGLAAAAGLGLVLGLVLSCA